MPKLELQAVGSSRVERRGRASGEVRGTGGAAVSEDVPAYGVSVTETPPGNLNIALSGFPKGVQVIEVISSDARWLADLALHRSDLLFAETSLKAISDSPSLPDDVLQSLWRSAIAHVYKCFGSSKSRSRLDPDRVLAAASHEKLENFKYYKAQRNKHMIHDENSYSQVSIIAVLNDGSHDKKTEGIRAMTLRFSDLNAQAHFNFSALLRWIQDWTAREVDEVTERIRVALEAKPMDALKRMPAPKHRAPTVEDASKARQRK